MNLPFAPRSIIADALSQKTATPTPTPFPLASQAAVTPKPGRRARLWELPEKFHCPLIGTCLSLDELTRLARRHGFMADPHDPFSLHIEAVAGAARRCAIAEDLQRRFERKYAGYVTRFETVKTEAELIPFWKSHFANGEVAGPMWAALTHKVANDATRHIVFTDVHMLSHQASAAMAADIRRLDGFVRENATLGEALERSNRSLAQQKTELRHLALELKTARAAEAVSRARAAELQERLDSRQVDTVIDDLQQQLRQLQAAHDALQVQSQGQQNLRAALQESRQQVATLRQEREQWHDERNTLERLILSLSENDPRAVATPGERDEEACEAPDGTPCPNSGSERCVLCVGGRHSLLGHYRELARRQGIALIHHDGGQEESLSRLPELINRADAVLCPTDCVSHAAYYKLKQHCKRTGKPCLLFQGAGVTGFAHALGRLNAGQASMAGRIQ